MQEDLAYFNEFLAQGNLNENHTVSHSINMTGLSYPQQLAETTGMQGYAQQHYRRLPTLFRPPGAPTPLPRSRLCQRRSGRRGGAEGSGRDRKSVV